MRSRQQVLADFGKDALNPANNLEMLMQQAAVRIAHALGGIRSKVLLYRPESADLLIVAGVGWKDGVVGKHRLPADLESPPGYAFQTRQPTVIGDIASSVMFRYSPLLREHGVRNLINVPIVTDSRTWGVLEADSEEPECLGDDDLDFMKIFASFLGSAILRRKYDEEAQAAVAQMARLADERNLLLEEFQHRVKNNLQTIMSVISLQKREMNDQAGRDALTGVADRVATIAILQDQLAPQKNVQTVRLGAYLSALCAYLKPERPELTIVTDIAEANAPSDQATPLGLILNEAVTNAIKHAFPGRAGVISVAFTVEERSRTATLVISDDGVGLSNSGASGSGRILTKALASQINAVVEEGTSPQGGMMITVRFLLRA